MTSVALAKRRIVVCILVLIFVAASVVISNQRKAQILLDMQDYEKISGLAGFLDKSQQEVGENNEEMQSRVSGYLGNSDVIDALDDRPLVADEDPDLEEGVAENENQDPNESGETPEEYPEEGEYPAEDPGEAPTEDSAKNANEGASEASESTPVENSKPKPVSKKVVKGAASAPKSNHKATKGASRNTGNITNNNQDTIHYKQYSAFPKGSISRVAKGSGSFASNLKAMQIPTLPEKQYPEIPPPTKENTKGAMPFRFYSHNVKNGRRHRELDVGEVPWESRKRHVINSIKLNAVANTVVLLQEPLKFQIDDILADLNKFSPKKKPEWRYYGGGREDGLDGGEHVPILVRSSEWNVVYNDTIWLNDLSERSAVIGWDAKFPRIATYVTLQHRESGKYINVANTHFDHQGALARKNSAILLSEKFRTLNAWPSFILGDLNAMPDDESHQELAKSYVDIHKLTPDFSRYGHPDYSVTGFSGKYLSDAKRIDYVFAPRYTKKLSEKLCDSYTRPFSLQVVGYGLLHSKFGGVYMSDHRPVMADFVMKGC
ncbi:hypothetical protein JCM33374_g1089 [Metschnikowia sp. JCM 33374]|nr:hypothetical protein JCM33374_g1089 [Metschnikowia sp. JCM 33374]